MPSLKARFGYRQILMIEAFALVIAILISISSGRYAMDIRDLVQGLLFSPPDSDVHVIFWLIRLPRTVLVLISGAVLALAGTVYQGVLRNPLVSPDILGVSSGASFGAVLSILVWNNTVGIAQVLSFCGGILAVVLALSMARAAKSDSTLGLILSGIVISSIASSLVMLFKYYADPYHQLPAVEYWMMGGFYDSDWKKVMIVLPISLIAAAVILLLRWQLKVLTLGRDEAMALGIRVGLIRGILIVAATVLVSVVVSVAGLVSWVGLVVPHIVRMMVGDDASKVTVASLGVGAVLLLLADTLARTVTASEIPISVITSFLGAPFLGYLLWKAGRKV